MKMKLIISCITAYALLAGGCTMQTNKPPAGAGQVGPVSDSQDGGAGQLSAGNNSSSAGSSANNNGRGNGVGSGANNQSGSGGLGNSGGLASNQGEANNGGGLGSDNVGNNAGQGSNANGTNQGGFGSAAYGGNAKGSYTPADLRDPRSILAQRIIYFDYNRAGIKPEYRNILDAHGVLLTDFPQLNIRLEGHADERGSREYNVALSERRAASVLDYLKIKGVSAGQADVVGYGEEVPATFGRGEGSWSKNRRVEIIYAGE